MSTPALEKTPIPQRDSPPPIWYDFDQKPSTKIETLLVKPKTQFSKAQNELPSCDGIPMDTERHRKQMELLINSLEPWLGDRGYIGGNMFVYFSPNQVKDEDFKGPDIFVVLDCSNHERKSWVVWEEKKSPNVVIELLSKTTAKKDKEKNKPIYQNQLGVQEYYWFDPNNPNDFQGFELQNKIYQKLPFQNEGFISQTLGLKLIRWHGTYKNTKIVWLRWATISGELLLLPEEIEAKRAEQEKQRAQAEAKRANVAEQRAQVALKEGERKERQKIARNLLAKGLDPTLVADTTGLSIEELTTI